MEKDIEQQLEESVKRFYDILQREPKFYHDADDDNSPTCIELVTLVFDNGKEALLKCKGTGSYDYVAMCRPRYDAEPTIKQIESIIKREGKEPITIKYRFNDQTKKKPQLILEFPYNSLKSIIQGGMNYSNVEFIYKIIEKN